MASKAVTQDEFQGFVNELFTRLDEMRAEDRKFFSDELDRQLDEKLEDKLKDHIGKLPTKEEYFKRQDEHMKELKTTREEQTVLSHQVSRNSSRLDRVEKHLDLPAFE